LQALESKRSELSGFANGGAALYSETIRYLTIVQIDNLWIQQLEVGRACLNKTDRSGSVDLCMEMPRQNR
jgi:hypothetical protein